jgi:hypothetical protein
LNTRLQTFDKFKPAQRKKAELVCRFGLRLLRTKFPTRSGVLVMLRVMVAGVMRPVRFVFFDVRGLCLRNQQRRAEDGCRQNQDEFFHILKRFFPSPRQTP